MHAPIIAAQHLEKIPASAPEQSEAVALRVLLDQKWTREYNEAKQKEADAVKASREKVERNFQGIAHDSFLCTTSTENHPMVSFDDGVFWWKDDGRCAERLQKSRDEDAQSHSYWATTIRVDTDMDSFRLLNEERTCQTFPDDKGRVATVTCDATPHTRHNIPVKFWGGVDRDTASDWKCTREKDEFVCRAID
jgi:hypothetical protein